MKAFIFLILFALVKSNIDTKLWRRVCVEETYFDKSRHFYVDGVIQLNTSIVFPSAAAWTFLWDPTLYCKRKDGTVLYTNHQVSPGYKNTSKAIPCYTSMEVDIPLKAVGYRNQQNLPSRYPYLLLDGINARGHDDCIETASDTLCWILVNLTTIIEIRKVVVTAHTNGWPQALPKIFTVKYLGGSSNVNPPDFSAFTLLGSFKTTQDIYGMDIPFNLDPPVQIRYLLFERQAGGIFTHFMLCHLQIF